MMMFFVLTWTEVYREDIDPKKKLDDIIHLAELCIEIIQQNDEHHAEVGGSEFHYQLSHHWQHPLSPMHMQKLDFWRGRIF